MRELAEQDGVVYVACGAHGLLLIAPGPPPTALARHDMGGVVSGFSREGGQLRAMVERSANPAPPVAVAPSPARVTHPAPSGPRVVLSVGEHVIIDRGAADGLTEGTHIEFFAETGADPIAVGVISVVATHRARVELGSAAIAQAVVVGSYARVSQAKPSASVKRPYEDWTARALLRTFVAVGNETGVGTLSDASLVRRAPGAFALHLAIAPIGVGSFGAFSFSGYLMPTFDTPYFEIGVGLGPQTVTKVAGLPDGSGTMFPIFMRMGKLDELNVALRVDWALFYSEPHFTALRLDGELPMTSRAWLGLTLGGGLAGYLLAELTARARLSSPSAPNQFDLLASSGFSMVASENDVIFGPHLGVGLQYHFH
ncbi:MAG: hypothetical protein QM756_47350 [Polyangiaceae bacterium]